MPHASFLDPSVNNKSRERAPRACQRCRNQKIRCDGFARAGGNCSPCTIAKTPCLYADRLITTSRTAVAPKWYVQSLEDKVERLEALIEKIRPGESFPELGPPIDRGNWSQPTFSAGCLSGIPASVTQDLQDLHIDQMKRGSEDDPRYYGTFSNATFMKKAVISRLDTTEDLEWHQFLQKVRNQPGRNDKWNLPEWQKAVFIPDKLYRFSFPPDALMHELIGLYFEHENVFMPVLHRPTFETMVQSRLHETDQSFGAVVLTVCACGARWSQDRRAWASDTIQSAGWHYYEQVHRVPRALAEPVTLPRLQLYALMTVFLSGYCLVSLEWSLLGMGLRYAVDIGAHMRKSFSSLSRAERELWKRAFWALFILDQIISNSLGRSPAIPLEDIDQDLPLEVDDEYWYHPDPRDAFKQPQGTSSSISSFNALIRLMRLLPKMAVTTRYNSPETLEIAQDHLADLDSSLNEWIEDLPPHLRLNDPSSSQDAKHFHQSTMLHGIYYMTVIITHRSFIPAPSDPIKSDSVALALCTNAARSCTRALHALAERYPETASPFMFITAVNAGVILMLNIWVADRRNRTAARAAAVIDIQKCLNILELCSERWPISSQLKEIMGEMMRMGELVQPSEPASLKRARPDDDGSSLEGIAKISRTDTQTSADQFSVQQPTPPEDRHSTSENTATPSVMPSTSMLMGPELTMNGLHVTDNSDTGDRAFLNALFPTGESQPSPVPALGGAQHLLDIWSGTSMGTDWSIWDHFLTTPMDPQP